RRVLFRSDFLRIPNVVDSIMHTLILGACRPSASLAVMLVTTFPLERVAAPSTRDGSALWGCTSPQVEVFSTECFIDSVLSLCAHTPCFPLDALQFMQRTAYPDGNPLLTSHL